MTPDAGSRSALDQRLDAAAQRVDDHVGDYVTPQFDPSARRPRRSGAVTATAIAAVLLLVIGIVAVNGGDPEGEEVANPDIVFDEVGEAVGGPRDGLDSLRLPVEVTPAEGLADGQVVTVSGSQFPPNTSLGVVMCVGYVNRAPAGAQNCRLSPYTAVTSDANGSFSVEHAVDRVFTTGSGEQIDCGGANEEWVCLVAVGALQDYDQSGIAVVSFDPSIPALPDPFVTLDPSGPYVDDQEATLTIGNVPGGNQYNVFLCVSDRGSHSCQAVVGSPVLTDGDGRGSTSVTIARKVDVGFGPVDCGSADVWCYLEVSGPDYVSTFDLQFVGAENATTATSIVAEPAPTTPTTAAAVEPDEVPTDTTAPATTTTQGTSGGTKGG